VGLTLHVVAGVEGFRNFARFPYADRSGNCVIQCLHEIRTGNTACRLETGDLVRGMNTRIRSAGTPKCHRRFEELGDCGLDAGLYGRSIGLALPAIELCSVIRYGQAYVSGS